MHGLALVSGVIVVLPSLVGDVFDMPMEKNRAQHTTRVSRKKAPAESSAGALKTQS
jgi:hypothetical protein